MGKVWTASEKRLALMCHTKQEFVDRYLKEIGMPDSMGRLESLWGQRKRLRDEMNPLIVPISSKSTAITPKPANNFPDIGESLSNISNKVSELIEIQKETLTLFKRLDKGEQIKSEENHG